MVVKEPFEDVTVPFKSDGWGPPDSSDVSSTSAAAAANLFPDASFSHSQKLGRVADFIRNPPTGTKSDPSFAIDEEGNLDDDGVAFRLVDGKSPPRRPKHGPKWRVNPHHNRNQLPQRRDEEAEKERARLNRNNVHHHQSHEVPAQFKSSVDIKSEWNMLEQIQFSSFSNLSLPVQEPEDLVKCGGLEYYNHVVYDRITPKHEKRLERFKNKNFFRVSTSDDPVIRRLANEDKATVFATDTVLAALMCAPRLEYSWDIVINRVKDKLFFDKRDGSQLDLVSVHETFKEALPQGKDDINSAYSLGVEATSINQNFSQQVLVRDGKKETFDEPNPFGNESGENDVSVAYRYRRWKLDDNISLVARCELQSVADLNDKRSFLTVNALNEFDPKYSGVDWRQKLETQRGAVLGTELKNNSNKLAKWTAQALLADADMMKIGYVSRVHPRDPFNHVVLSVLGYKPKDFAEQISLNTLNMWGIVKYVVDVCMKLREGKYVLVKDPSKPQFRIYEVPHDAFENDYVEEPIPEDEQVHAPEESTEASVATANESKDKKADDAQA